MFDIKDLVELSTTQMVGGSGRNNCIKSKLLCTVQEMEQ